MFISCVHTHDECINTHTHTHTHTHTCTCTEGIGDSGQGMANGVLLVFLIPLVRKRLMQVVLFWRPVVEQPIPESITHRMRRHAIHEHI